MSPKRQRRKPTCGCEPHGGSKCPFHEATHRPKSLGTFTIDSDEDDTSTSPSPARAKAGSASMKLTTTHVAGIAQSISEQAKLGLAKQEDTLSKPYVSPYVEDAQPTPERDVIHGQKRKRSDLWDQTGNVRSLTTASMSRGVRLAGPLVRLPCTLPKVEEGTISAVIAPSLAPREKVIHTPMRDDSTEALASSGATRSYTVGATPLEQLTPTKSNVHVMSDHQNAAQRPSKLAGLVMHAFEINQHAFADAELRRLLRLYKVALSRGDKQDESLQYRTFFLHLWMHVGARQAKFDLEALISGICNYQEMAMTDVEVSRRIIEIQMEMAKENEDGVKDRAGDLWAYVWETYDPEESSLNDLMDRPALRA